MAGTEIAVCYLRREHLEVSLSLWNYYLFFLNVLKVDGEPGKLSYLFLVVERQRISTVEFRKCHAPHKSDFTFKAVPGFHF